MVLALLGLALAIFLARMMLDRTPRRERVLGFGIGFSAFLSAWILVELIGTLAPPAWVEISEGLHFGVLLALAVWLNVRWGWAFLAAREGS
ncbi:MAG: hypothetical protein ACE5JE_05445 [Thermoplasmata archaeon]